MDDVDEIKEKKKEKVKFSIYDLIKLEMLGYGNSGQVMLVQHKHTMKKFALKIIPLKNDPKIKENIELEVKTLHNCESDNIIRCHASYFENGAINIVLEYMDKGTLTDITKKVKKIPEDILGIISYQIIKGLEYLHRVKRIVHRDIKPSNILLNSKGFCKISDFGVSGSIFDSQVGRSTLIGTYIYMSPERFEVKKYSFVSDIWSVALSIMECAIGFYPYLLNNNQDSLVDFWSLAQIITEKDSPVLNENEFSLEFADFIKICLNKDPSLRPTAASLLSHPFILLYENRPPSDLAKWLSHVK